MRLHEIPRGSLIRAQTINSKTKEKVGEFLTFHGLDGLCSVYGSHMEYTLKVDLSTEIEQVGDYYLIKS